MLEQRYDDLAAQLRPRLPEYLERHGISLGPGLRRKIRCLNPQHTDNHPSMSYDAQRHRLHCFSCGANYDLFSLIGMDYPECGTFPQQLQKAAQLFGERFPGPAAPERLTQPAPEADFTALVRHGLEEHGPGGPYLEGRGLSRELCARYGLYQTAERAVLPVWRRGKCVCYCGRAVSDQLQPRYKNSPGRMELWGADYFDGEGLGGPLFITEAILDALSVEECGFRAVALCGAANVQRLLQLCAQNPAAASRYLFFAAGDQDGAGARMNEQLCQGLARLGLGCRVLELPEGFKDCNQLLCAEKGRLRQLLESAAGAGRAEYNAQSAVAGLEELLDLAAHPGIRQPVPTGFAKLDKLLDGGLYTGLYVLGAISSLGKTSYLLQMADQIARGGRDVLYFSLEMGRLELVAKSLSRLSWQADGAPGRVYASTLREVLRPDPKASAAKRTLLAQAVEEYRSYGGRLFFREGLMELGARELRAAVAEHLRQRGERPVVMVDYLQILKPDDPRATDKQNTDRAVVELKRISRDFDLPVVAVSSFNRDNYRAAVCMEAFKESGAVEYSSDVLLGMQLEGAGESGFDVNLQKRKNPRPVELVLLKNRSGLPYGKLPLRYYAKYSCFAEQ